MQATPGLYRHCARFAPEDVPKTGSGADLAIAIRILIWSEQFTARAGRAAIISGWVSILALAIAIVALLRTV